MPKKHDPQERERKDGMPKNKSRNEVVIHLVHWSDRLVNISIISLWIQYLILQHIWAKQTTFYLIHRNSIYTIRVGEIK